MKSDKILVIDFGSQYNQLIARRIREMGVFSELVPSSYSLEAIKSDDSIKGIVFSGGPHSVYDDNSFSVDPAIFDLGIPILGICYGMQIMAHLLGGKVAKGDRHEYGKAQIQMHKSSEITAGFEADETVWMSHGDFVQQLPVDFEINASSSSCPIAIMSHNALPFYGLQFHPEVVHTPKGKQLLHNFVFSIAKASSNWTMQSFLEEQVEAIQAKVQDQEVLCALSGGVDSAVVAALIHRAIGDRLTCIFVDHGLLRKNEAESVVDTFQGHFGMHLVVVDAKERFLSKLKDVVDPEQKRKIIGKEFIDVFEEVAQQFNAIPYLAQGTLYSDVIESGTQTAQTIKSHHNVGGLPKNMRFQLIEPLNTLFKDEVRLLGKELGLPDEIVHRQPFPGPGLAIRVLGEVTEDKLELVRESDAILREEIQKAGLQSSIWQYFTALTNMRSVGVMGDQRTYDYTIGIRAVTSIDGMTADWARIPYDVLAVISSRIVNEVRGINRVVLDITSKPPATIEWE